MPRTKSDPERRCIATGEVLAKEQMIRFVVGPENFVVPDVAGKLPGRGIWLRSDPQVLQMAMAKKQFSRAAKSQVSVPVDLVATIGDLLAHQALNYLGLARRAGELTTGFEKVRSMLAQGGAVVLLGARDGAQDGKRKLHSLAEKISQAGEKDIKIVELFSAAELSVALGRENVVHAALAKGGLASKFAMECNRLAPFRDVMADSSPEIGSRN